MGGVRAFGVWLPPPSSRVGRAVWAFLLAAIIPPQQLVAAQDPEAQRVLSESEGLAAAGDTAGAIALLESAARTHSVAPEVLARLAWLYAARASHVPTDFLDRQAAERYALRAWERDPRDPWALGALAWIRFKQHRDAAAADFAEQALANLRFATAPSELRADLHYLRGRVWERQASDFENLVHAPPDLAVATPQCSALGTFCRNFTDPVSFNEKLEHAHSLAELGADERRRMVQAYLTAVETDPTHVHALSRLLLALADDGDWESYLDHARRGVESNPGQARVHLWLSLGLHRSGQAEEAAEAVARGLNLLPVSSRRHYTDPLALLTEEDSARMAELQQERRGSIERLVWAKSDPLWLTETNERWLEHVARVVYADLKFAPEEGGLQGSETDAGRIYVRYGPPRALWAVRRDKSKETDEIQMQHALDVMEACARAVTAADGASCVAAEGAARHSVHGGGRWIFWSYARDRPGFVFTRDLRMSNLRFMQSAYSETYAEEVRARLPSIYEPFARKLDMPHQLVRFKDAVETYMRVPLDELVSEESDSVQVGAFFVDAEYGKSYEWTTVLPARPKAVPVMVRTALPVGYFDYSLEAYDPRGEAVVRARGSVVTQSYVADTLALSDLLVVDRMAPPTEPVVAREDLALRGSPDLTFEEGDPVGLYWETYGLRTADGYARYEVSIEVRDSRERNLVVRVLGALAGVFGRAGREGTSVTWTREAWIGSRDRSLDWVELGELPQGSYRIVVTIRDLVSGTRADSEREIRVRP